MNEKNGTKDVVFHVRMIFFSHNEIIIYNKVYIAGVYGGIFF